MNSMLVGLNDKVGSKVIEEGVTASGLQRISLYIDPLMIGARMRAPEVWVYDARHGFSTTGIRTAGHSTTRRLDSSPYPHGQT